MPERSDYSPQFVGQADATREAGKPAEFALTPEQRQVVDVMQQSGEKFTKKMLRESEKARQKLQRLRGKELVEAGMKKVGLGLGIGWATETAGKFTANRLPQKAGTWLGKQGDKLMNWLGSRPDEGSGAVNPTLELSRSIQNGLLALGYEDFTRAGPDFWKSDIGPNIGNVAGVELSGPVYRLLTGKANLPKLRWYEWVVGQAGAFLPSKTTMHIKRFELNFVNPVTVSGLFNVAQGLYDMATQKPKNV